MGGWGEMRQEYQVGKGEEVKGGGLRGETVVIVGHARSRVETYHSSDFLKFILT